MRMLAVFGLLLLPSASGAQALDAVRVDPRGIPVWCPPPELVEAARAAPHAMSVGVLPAGTRGWECIPGVIRNDGIETFRLEVNVNGPANSVVLTGLPVRLVGPSAEPIALHEMKGTSPCR